ncbi:response regulator [Candidatus Uabimicrobium sp. HlEnr_7]|uniref:response regulator n=1 Tax=Candidatus Uabimicrobium helgolandensis TaxID=3095367 RepID=UPI003555C4C5
MHWKILLADDSQISLLMTKKALENKRMEVVTATDGIDAIRIAYSELPDAIILDLEMPRFDGIQTCRILKEDDYFRNIPIIILTGNDSYNQQHWSYLLGADAYFIKPSGAFDLEKTVENIIQFLLENHSVAEKRNTTEDVLSRILKLFYQQLFASSLKFNFTQCLSQIKEIKDFQKQTLIFLQKTFPASVYFIMIDDGQKSYTAFLSSFEKSSSTLDSVKSYIHSTFHSLTQRNIKDGDNYYWKINKEIDHTKLNFYSDVLPFKTDSSIQGLIGLANVQISTETEIALSTICEEAKNLVQNIFTQNKMKLFAPLKAYNSLLETLNHAPNLDSLLQKSLQEISHFSNSQVGAFFIKDQKTLSIQASYNLVNSDILEQSFDIGKGLVGQVAKSRETLLIGEETPFELEIDTGLGKIKAKNILLVPIFFQTKLFGVLVLGSISAYSKKIMQHITPMSTNIAIAISNAIKTEKVKQLVSTLENKNLSLQKQYQEIEMQQKQILEQKALEEKNRELKQANVYKDEFLANMSHELRTPLNAVIGYVSLVLKGCKTHLPEKYFKSLSNARVAARTLLQLINDILDFSKIEAGKMKVSISPVDINEIIDNVILTSEGLTLNKNVELRYEIPQKLVTIQSDSLKIHQILNNLVGNAIKFTSEGHITLKAIQTNTSIKIDIEDTGCGIDDNKISTLFESFHQGDNSIAKKYGGTGLGLTITKKLCILLGIKISVVSELRKGSIFSIEIPLHNKQLQQNSPLEQSNQERAEQQRAVLVCLGTNIEKKIKQSLRNLPFYITDNIATQNAFAIFIDNNCSKSTNLFKKSSFSAPIIHIGKKTAHTKFFLENILESEKTLDALLTAKNIAKDILIIDDAPMNLDLANNIFERSGYKIYNAVDGKKGLQIAEERVPTVILTDIAMPEMTGFELLKNLQKRKLDRKITIIACSAMARVEDTNKAYNAGFHGYITKPITSENIVLQVKQYILQHLIKKHCENSKNL